MICRFGHYSLLVLLSNLQFTGAVSAVRRPIAAAEGRPGAKAAPHILWIVADDLGWSDLGFRNSQQVLTPTIDKLANESVVLQNYYVHSSCSPTRASFLTGRYPLRHGINHAILPGASYGLPLSEVTIAQRLKQRGYQTHMIGKWHLGSPSYNHTPTFRGFDSFYGFYGGGEDYFTHISGGAYDFRRDEGAGCGKGCSRVETGAYGTYSTELFSRRAVQLIQRHPQKSPLFLYLCYQAAHHPQQVPAHYLQRYHDRDSSFAKLPWSEQIFNGMLSALDDGVQEVISAMAARDMDRNAIVLFTTDNGGPSESVCGPTSSSNFPMRGSKCTIWEGGTKGTAFLRLPQPGRSGRSYDGLIHAVDWLPTLLSATGTPQESETAIDGLDLWPSLLGRADAKKRVEVYYGLSDLQVGTHGPALRVGDLKLMLGTQAPNLTWHVGGDLGGEAPGVWRKRNETLLHSFEMYSMISHPPPSIFRVGIDLHPERGHKLEPRAGMDVFDATYRPQEVMNGGVAFVDAELGSEFSSAQTKTQVVKGRTSIPKQGFPNLSGKPACALYNVTKDPGEMHDLASHMPQQVGVLLNRLRTLAKDRVCMDCELKGCPDAKLAHRRVDLADGTQLKAWEPHCSQLYQ